MRKFVAINKILFGLSKKVSSTNSPQNLIQIIKIFLKNIEEFQGLLKNKIGEISNFFEVEIKELDKKYFKNADNTSIPKNLLSKIDVDKQYLEDYIKTSSEINYIKDNQHLLIQSYQKSLELVKHLEIYSNLCINIFIKNYSFEDILHAKTNIIMKNIYHKIKLEKKILIT